MNNVLSIMCVCFLECGSQDHSLAATTAAQVAEALNSKNKSKLTTAAQVAEALNSKNEPKLTTLLEKLEEPKELALAVIRLTDALHSNDEDIAVLAIRGLRQLGSMAKAASPALIRSLRNPFRLIREEALFALQYVDPENPEVISAITIALEDQDVGVRGGAAYVLGEIGRDPKRLIPELSKRIRDKDPYVRAEAARALYRIDKDQTQKVVPILIAILEKGSNVRACVVAMGTVREIGPMAKDSAQSLIKILKNPSFGYWRSRAALALAATKPDDSEVAAALIDVLGDKDAAVSCFVGHALMKIGPNTIPRLAKAFKEKPACRQVAAQVLGSFGAKAKSCIPMLESALDDPDPVVRERAAEALNNIKLCLSKK
jgi:HEAT repeat protein